MEIMRLANGICDVEVLPEVGGRIHRLRAYGRDLLRTPARVDDHLATARTPLAHFYWGSYPLVPWVNRIPDGLLVYRGVSHRLPLNLDGYAIHGEAYRKPWRRTAKNRLEFQGGDDRTPYPWRYSAVQSFELSATALTLHITLTNDGDSDMPGGIGIHPWFRADVPFKVQLPATLVYPARDCMPVGEPHPVSDKLDRRLLSPVPWGTDDVWTGLTDRNITLEWPSLGLRMRYGFGQAATHVVMAAIEDVAAVAVEPVTHAGDGFRLLEQGERGAIGEIAPGSSLEVEYSFAISELV